MEHTQIRLPEHLRRELFDDPGPASAGGRRSARGALLAALIVALTVGGALWITGVSAPWPL
jgi:hypothetical protein